MAKITNWYGTVIVWKDSNDNAQTISVDSDWVQNIDITNAYNSTTDSLKVESNGQNYYDLLPTSFIVPATTSVTVGAGSNYTMSATGAWILHADIKRAKAIQIYGNWSQQSQVKLYVSPIDSPDQNTPEYQNGSVNTQATWMYLDKTWASTGVNVPMASSIIPISANALKFYIYNESATTPETVTLFIRLIF